MRTGNTQSLERKFEQAKDKQFKDQFRKVYHAFREKPMTMLEADMATGIMRSNICWYVNDLLEQGRIAILRQRKCSITGFTANEYTTNPDLFPESDQLKLF